MMEGYRYTCAKVAHKFHRNLAGARLDKM